MRTGVAKTHCTVPEDRRRRSPLARTVVHCLVTGLVATAAAATLSLLVDGVAAKRAVWLTVTVGLAVAGGVWRAFIPLTEHQQEAGSRR